MRWKGRRTSSNVDDRRMSTGKAVGGGVGVLGVILFLVFSLLTGGNLDDGLNNGINFGNQNISVQDQYVETEEDKELAEFTSVVLADTEDVWHDLFSKYDRTYNEPTMVLFNEAVNSGCGYANSQVGPFYCPADSTIYIDLSFFRDLREKFSAPGDFAMAYVIAHEVGHHVQNEMGISDQTHRAKQNMSDEQANALSVRVELQADYLAGVFAKHIENKGYLEKGDIEEAITAANAIGDDTLQKQARGYVVPDSFTHGTSEQRVKWFMKGFEAGDLSEWDTFNTDDL